MIPVKSWLKSWEISPIGFLQENCLFPVEKNRYHDITVLLAITEYACALFAYFHFLHKMLKYEIITVNDIFSLLLKLPKVCK